MSAWVLPENDIFYVVCRDRYYRFCYKNRKKADVVATTLTQLWNRKLANHELDLERDFRNNKKDVELERELVGADDRPSRLREGSNRVH